MWETVINSLQMLEIGFSSICKYWAILTCLLALQCAFSIAIAELLSNAALEKDILSSLSFLGGILLLTLFCLALACLKIKPTPEFLIPLLLVSFLILVWKWKRLQAVFSPTLGWLGLFFLFILGVRLIYIHGLIVPPYADSVLHMQIVQDMLNPDHPARAFYRISLDLSRYYHFGFHALAAWLSELSKTDPAQTILVLGQYFQAMAILGLYPLARIVFGKSLPAWLVMIAAGLFLPIPAYTSNWGKYPAIASLSGMLFVLSVGFIYQRNNKLIQHQKFWWLAGLTIISTIFLHNRSAIIFILAGIFFLLFNNGSVKRLISSVARKRITCVIVAIILAGLFIFALVKSNLPIHSTIFFVFLTVMVLFAFWGNYEYTLIIVLFTLLAAAFSLFPIGISNRVQSVLDRPFFIIFCYIPISFLITIGPYHVLSIFPAWRRVGLSLLILMGLLNTVFLQNQHPADWSILVDGNDLTSFQWMKLNLPTDVVVGIASMPTGNAEGSMPADGGAWLEPLTGISTHYLPFDTDFLSQSTILCQSGVTYIYVDGLDYSFDVNNLLEAGATQTFRSGNVSIYQLDCKDLVTRAQIAVFIERGIHGPTYNPPAATGMVFIDVPIDYWAAKWIEKLYADGISSGCSNPPGLMYCPETPVTRAQMAVFLLRAEHGEGYTPPAAGISTGFADVPVNYWSAAWIKQLASEGIATGCGDDNYCPDAPVTREQMTVFLEKTFTLR
jgi:hypothetical protein